MFLVQRGPATFSSYEDLDSSRVELFQCRMSNDVWGLSQAMVAFDIQVGWRNMYMISCSNFLSWKRETFPIEWYIWGGTLCKTLKWSDKTCPTT